MEGEGKYFKVCILRKSASRSRCANSKSGVYAIPSTIQLTSMFHSYLSRVEQWEYADQLRAFPYLYGMYSYSGIVLQRTQLFLISLELPIEVNYQNHRQRSKVQFPPR